MKINYKIITLVLTAILLITYTWHWEDIFFHNRNKMSYFSGVQQIPNDMMMGGDDVVMEMSMDNMIKSLDGKTGKFLEKAFILQMIPHHQGAVDMAKKLLTDSTVNKELKKFANEIITAQEGEIKMMNEWLNKY